MKVKTLIERLQEFDPEASIILSSDPDLKEKFIISEFNQIATSLIFILLKQD